MKLYELISYLDEGKKLINKRNNIILYKEKDFLMKKEKATLKKVENIPVVCLIYWEWDIYNPELDFNTTSLDKTLFEDEIKNCSREDLIRFKNLINTQMNIKKETEVFIEDDEQEWKLEKNKWYSVDEKVVAPYDEIILVRDETAKIWQTFWKDESWVDFKNKLKLTHFMIENVFEE